MRYKRKVLKYEKCFSEDRLNMRYPIIMNMGRSSFFKNDLILELGLGRVKKSKNEPKYNGFLKTQQTKSLYFERFWMK